VGRMTFPTSLYNKDTKFDIHFIGVTSCDTCRYIHLDAMHYHYPNTTEDYILEIGPMRRSLLEMANDDGSSNDNDGDDDNNSNGIGNFTDFEAMSFEKDVTPVWPFPEKYRMGSTMDDMRMLRTHPNGTYRVGFLARQKFGVLRYRLDEFGKIVVTSDANGNEDDGSAATTTFTTTSTTTKTTNDAAGDLFFPSNDSITGINFSSTHKRLVAVGNTYAYIFDITGAGYPTYYAPLLSLDDTSTDTSTDTSNTSKKENNNDDDNDNSIDELNFNAVKSMNMNVTHIHLVKECMDGRYRNAVLWDEDDDIAGNLHGNTHDHGSKQIMVVDGHNGNGMKGGVSIVLQKLELSAKGDTTRSGDIDIDSNGNGNVNVNGGNGGTSWGNCKVIAGHVNQRVGWRDGCGKDVRFSRPHDMTLLPKSHQLIMTDIDNRAIRLVDYPPAKPTNSKNNKRNNENDNEALVVPFLLSSSSLLSKSNHDNNDDGNHNDDNDDDDDAVCVSTVSYDEGLYQKIFPVSQEEDAGRENDGEMTATAAAVVAAVEEQKRVRRNTNAKKEEEQEKKKKLRTSTSTNGSGDVSKRATTINAKPIMKAETKVKATTKTKPPTRHRKPFIPKKTTRKFEKITWKTSQRYCRLSKERKNSDICTLEEVRTLFRHGSSNDRNDHDDDNADEVLSLLSNNPFWTKAQCQGCWKRHKGICTRGDPKWDSDYYMVATIVLLAVGKNNNAANVPHIHHLDVEDEDWDEDWDGNKDEDKHEYKHKDKDKLNDLPERFLRTECTQKESPQPPLTLTSTSALTSTQYEDNYLYSLTPMPMNILCCGDVDIYVSQDEGIKASG